MRDAKTEGLIYEAKIPSVDQILDDLEEERLNSEMGINPHRKPKRNSLRMLSMEDTLREYVLNQTTGFEESF